MEFKVNDGTDFVMNYEVVQNVLPVATLFIHGNCASNRWWYPSVEIFEKQAEGKDYSGSIIMAEFRGCGKSSTPKEDKEVDMHTFANDFIALVKSLDEGPVNLVGHSTGGLIAAIMLAQEPGLFAKAVLLDPVGARGVKFEDSMIAAFEQMKVNKDLVAVVIGSTIHNNNPNSEFFKQILVEDASHAVKSVGHLVLKALDGLDVRLDIKGIAKPVLVLHGEHDTLLPMADSKAMAELMSDAQFQVIPGQGHCTNVENPEKFVNIAQSFLF
ncbi:Non-heme chloroperoxidase [compost metagenome]